MTPAGYTLLLLTGIMAALVAVVAFAVLRFMAAARDAKRGGRAEHADALMSTALEEAVARLKAQQRATAARADASERLSGEIISSLTAGLLVVGLNGEFRILNPAGRRMLNIPESLAPADYRRTVHEQPLLDVVDECLKTGMAIVRRPVALPEDLDAGLALTHLGVTVSPLTDEDGQLHGAICLFTDLTAVKELEEQLRLKESLAAVGELTAGIAHEFRNGLATIQGYSKLLRPEGAARALPARMSKASATRRESLSEVVTNFLNFARPAQLTLTDGRSARDLRARRRRDPRRRARARRRRRRCAASSAVVDGDEVLLRQAFSNLLRNALEACAGAASRAAHRRSSRRSIRREAVADRGQRQRARHRAGAARARVPPLLHVASATALALASRWCRRSSSSTTAGLSSARRRKAAPACRLRCRRPSEFIPRVNGGGEQTAGRRAYAHRSFCGAFFNDEQRSAQFLRDFSDLGRRATRSADCTSGYE